MGNKAPGKTIPLPYNETLFNFVNNARLSEVKDLSTQNLLYFDSQEDTTDCFTRLVKKGVHSAPVYDCTRKEFIGMLDWKDFAAYVVRLFCADPHCEKDLIGRTADSLSDLSKTNPFFPIFSDSSMLEVLKGMGGDNVHRRPIIEITSGQPAIKGVVSQSDVIRWLHDNKSKIGHILSGINIETVKEVEEKVLQKRDVVLSVPNDVKMLMALRLIVENAVNGVAVVEGSKDDLPLEGKRLLGNISVSDLPYMVLENLDNLELTVEQFMAQVPRRPLIALPPTVSLMDVIDELAKSGTYRVYIVDENQVPLTVITITDVINAVLLQINSI